MGHAAVGTESTAATYQQEVGVAIHSGFKGDDYRMQQVAFLRWTGANASTFTLDSLTVNGAACFRILNVPLVNPVAPLWDDNTWQASGRPFFVGDANTTTAGRTQAGVMPSAFGGGAFATPATQGKETMLEIRWEKSDPTVGLDGGPADDVRVGQGGEWVILVGRQTVAA
ncbi:MAG: hypothetical protein FJ100_21365 [Deltaproteobacteria bacterium]|nr:hypothetical protein [Deltaproteobacteria bacterium]